MEQPETEKRLRKPSDTPPRESRRERKYRQRRQAIIEAARKVFEGKGYERASIAEIAGAADFAKGSIYYYFNNKAAILDAVIGNEIEQIRGLFTGIIEEGSDPLARLERLVSQVLEFYERNFALFRIIVAPMTGLEGPDGPTDQPSLRKKSLDLFEQNRKDLIRIIKEAQKGGLLSRAIPPDEAADLLQGLLNAEVHRWDQGGRKEKLVSKQALITDVFLNGLKQKS